MADIRPFRAIRPVKDKVHLVASRSVDSYPTQELKFELQTNPFTFLRIIKPESGSNTVLHPNSPEFLHKIKDAFSSFQRAGILEQESKECLYIYQQEKPGASYSGIIACASVEDYVKGDIRIHEQTLTDREEKLMHYLEICDFNAEPVLMCHPLHEPLDQLIRQIQQEQTLYDFSTIDLIRHRIWRVEHSLHIEKIQEYYREIGPVYIADGHHRSASSNLLARVRKKHNPAHTGKEPYNFFLSAFFSESQLHIYDFNRVVKDLNNLYEDEFIEKLNENFKVEKIGEQMYVPEQRHHFSMYVGGNWYKLVLNESLIDENDPVGKLDSELLTRHILTPVLGIKDLKTDNRVIFVNGTKGHSELKKHVDGGKMKVAFGLYPVDMDQLKNVADNKAIMPPKTTYIEPKLRSGLLIYSLS